jgi:hypothetical protein
VLSARGDGGAEEDSSAAKRGVGGSRGICMSARIGLVEGVSE